MVNIFYFLVFMALSVQASGQAKAMTFEEAKKLAIFDKLDSQYPGGIGGDSTKSVFKSRESYIQAYQEFITDLGKYLSKNGFKWGKQVRCFNKVYFSRDGKVDFFLYNFTEAQLSGAQQIQFANLLAQYIKEVKFGLPASSHFAQCSPVRYEDL